MTWVWKLKKSENQSVRDANVPAEKQQEEKSKAPATDNLQTRQSGKIKDDSITSTDPSSLQACNRKAL